MFERYKAIPHNVKPHSKNAFSSPERAVNRFFEWGLYGKSCPRCKAVLGLFLGLVMVMAWGCFLLAVSCWLLAVDQYGEGLTGLEGLQAVKPPFKAIY